MAKRIHKRWDKRDAKRCQKEMMKDERN